MACGIFPNQGSNPWLLHWKVDSFLLSHQGNPRLTFYNSCRCPVSTPRHPDYLNVDLEWGSGISKRLPPQMILMYRQDWNWPQETCFYTLVCAFKVFNEQCFEYISSYRLISNYLVFVPVKNNNNVSRENGLCIVAGIIKWYFEKQFGHFLKC